VRKPVLALAAVALLAAGVAAPAPAAAAGRQLTIIQDDFLAVHSNDAYRVRLLNEARALGVDVVKVQLLWREVAPAANSSRKPRVDLRDPANYNFARFDAFVRDAVARDCGHTSRSAARHHGGQPKAPRPSPVAGVPTPPPTATSSMRWDAGTRAPTPAFRG
jgi:hypothetical protein